MNVFHKVTIETIKKNKIRTLVTIIGIMLSTALIFSVTTSLYSFICFGKDMAIYETGDWHGMALPLTQDRVDELRDDPKIDEVFCLNAIGYADTGVKSSFSPKGEKNNYNFTVIAADDECFEKLPYYLKSGRYPENDSEIIISNSFFIRDIDDEFKAAGKGEIGLGSTFDMDMTIDLSGGIDDISLDEPDTGKLLKKASEITGTHKSYTIVGIYEEMYFNDLMEDDIYSIMCLTRGDSKSDNGVYTAYFKMKMPGYALDYLNQHFNFNEEKNAGIITKTNDELLQFSLSGATASAGFLMSIFMIGAFILGLIMFGSVALIYNAFAISVSERTKQFGLLSSIGATKKQINRMIEFEALLLSLIGIPLGILLGYCGIGITFKALGSRFDSITGMINGSNALSLKLHVSWAVILITILVAEFTVRFSAWLPSVRAQRISAVDAIRQSGDIKAKNKRIRTPKLIYKLFGLPGVLAQKYFKRSKKRYRATVWSLFMSITLFVSASAFTSYLVKEIEEDMQTESYDIMYESSINDKEEAENLFDKLKDADDVREAACTEYNYVQFHAQPELFSDDIKAYGSGYSNLTEDHTDYGAVCFVDDDLYRDYLKDKGFDTDKFMDPDHPVALLYDTVSEYDIATDRTYRMHIYKDGEIKLSVSQAYVPEGYELFTIHTDGKEKNYECRKTSSNESDDPETIYLPIEEADLNYDVEIGGNISKRPFFATSNDAGSIFAIYPESLREKVIPKPTNEHGYVYTFISDDHRNTTDSIRKILEALGEDDEMLYDYAAEVESIRNVITIIKVFAYGFIIIISLIAAANVFNTISTNVYLRRREFAMLRSVGMDKKGLNRMMNYECLLYGGKSLMLGLPVSFLITYFIYKSFKMNFETTYQIPWTAAAIAAISVFIVVFATMIYSMRKIKKDNPIDALKNENL